MVSPCLCQVDGQDSAPWALQGAAGGVQPAQILLFSDWQMFHGGAQCWIKPVLGVLGLWLILGPFSPSEVAGGLDAVFLDNLPFWFLCSCMCWLDGTLLGES